jgi:hypothetical protein
MGVACVRQEIDSNALDAKEKVPATAPADSDKKSAGQPLKAKPAL